jgi:hypothetical protein
MTEVNLRKFQTSFVECKVSVKLLIDALEMKITNVHADVYMCRLGFHVVNSPWKVGSKIYPVQNL